MADKRDKAGQAVLRAVERKHKRVTAESLVTDAKATNHPWHHRFVWDDTKAGHLYRLYQARDMIAAVHYQEVRGEQIFRSCAYVRDPEAAPNEQGYVSVVKLRTDLERARDVLLVEFERVGHALRRARELAGVLNLSEAVNDMIVNVEGLAARVSHHRPAGRSGAIADS